MLTTHDTYCRCRVCKPPLVGDTRRQRYEIAAIILLAVIAAIMVVSS